MNTAIMIACLIFGTSVVEPPTGNNGADLEGIAPPTTSMPIQPELRNAIQRQSRTPSRGVPASQSRGYSGNTRQSTTMPTSPTDNNSDTGQQYQWLPPTAGSARGGAATGGGQPSGFYGQKLPYSPTHARPGQAQSNAAMQDAQLQRMRIEAASQVTSQVQQPATKAYSGVQLNQGYTSPYMNLYRSGNSNGTIDNYTSLVRPELNQRQTNQQFGSDIRGLENSSRVQRFNLNQLNRDTHNLQGVKYQQFFMNYGDFYPNAR